MRFRKLIVPAVALGFFAAIPSITARADDTAAPPAATQPAATGSVTIKVVDSSGNPVAGAKVVIVAPHKKGDPQPAERPAPIAQGVTDAQGSLTLTDIPDGNYRANANLKGTGRGSEKVTVSTGTDAATSPVTITLKAKRPKGDAGAPATQPAQ